MMRSIKIKLFLGISLIISVLLSGIFIYGLCFKGYFENEKLNEMKLVIEKVEQDINSVNIEKLSSIIVGYSEKYSVQIDIESNITGMTICATHNTGKGMNMNGISGHRRFETLETISSKEGVENKLVHDKSTGAQFLTAEKAVVDDNYIIIVRTPVNIVDDAVSKSIKLMLIIFMPITVVILVLTFFLADRFTKPVIQITKKTTEITKLDFNEDIKIEGKDEIAVLGGRVNELSHKIENTLEELKLKNNTLEDMIRKERENEELRREFVSSVSHELKSPIAVISGYAQALQEKVILEEKDKEYYIGIINEEADRMQVIVNDLLDLYKLQSNTFKLNLREVDLGLLVENIVKKNSLIFKEYGVNLKVDIENSLVKGDEIRLEQAIQNYINNALSHMDENKVLEIKTNSSGKVTVYNSGSEISKENQDKIWQGFVRIDKVRNYKEKRVGLGLSIVKQIIDLHEGQCGVSNKNSGVEFWLKINTI